ncbi:GNAT family N-acetyltransferase, partial [Candidatus Dependentiae bacterium]|nr:GNAT family N-acetyltransferase [Candidatus Dependentiae bacterium]
HGEVGGRSGHDEPAGDRAYLPLRPWLPSSARVTPSRALRCGGPCGRSNFPADVFGQNFPAQLSTTMSSGRSRAERLILISEDSPDVAVGSVIVAESAVLPRGATPGTINCTLNSLVIAPKMRGGGHGRTLTVAAARWAMEHMNAGVVTAWCVKPLLALYVDRCGFEYEPPAKASFDDDDDGDVCCRAWAHRWRGEGAS